VAPSSEDPHLLPPSDDITRTGPARTIDAQPAVIPVQAGTGVISNIGDNNITGRAEQIRYSTDEAMVWQEAPSLALLVPRAIKYIVLLAVIFIACAVAGRVISSNPGARAALESSGIHAPAAAPSHRAGRKARGRPATPAADASSDAPADSTAVPSDAAPASDATDQPTPYFTLGKVFFLVKSFFAALFALLLLVYFFRLKATRYSASSQRLIVEEGAWHAVSRPYELHQLGDAVIVKPALLRMFGVANLIVTKPEIELNGLRNAEYVRDILRQGGQLEAQRVDKIRWR
jgi:hypothetical protein